MAKLDEVIFLGGGPRPPPSVQIRCIDMAGRLGCECRLGLLSAEHVPEKFRVFVCVKPSLPVRELIKLSQRGKVVWDILDVPPPPGFVAVHLASTKFAGELFARYGKVAVLPHYHCNFEGAPNPPDLRRPGWIGARQWRPKLPGVKFDRYFVEGTGREGVVNALRQIGIGLNFRGRETFTEEVAQRLKHEISSPRERRQIANEMYQFHLVVNSGIKLINCLGFGIPSISGDEPAYHEIGEGCTIISTPAKCARWVRELQRNDELYAEMRRQCIKKSRAFHIDAVAQKYRKFLQSL